MHLQNIKNYLTHNWIKLFTLGLLIVLSWFRITYVRPYNAGDGVEYTLITEAFFNHFTPEVKVSDCESFKNKFADVADWKGNNKAPDYDAAQKYIADTNKKLLDHEFSFFADKKQRMYSCHFWLYSLVNVPMRAVCAIHPFNPFRIFDITNVLLIVLSCFVFFKTSSRHPLIISGFCFLFFFSTNYWYINWSHPEVFTVCFISMGLWLFLNQKLYWGILLVSIAALQNQPIVLLTAVLGIIALLKNGFNFKNILYIVLSSIIVLIPSVFYYYHFGEPNLIKYVGASSADNITVTRIIGMFFDLNQGMVLAFPGVLLLYFLLYFLKIFKKEHWKDKLHLLLLPSLILMTIAAATINNWNSGQAVVSRYVCYIGGAMLVHFFFLLMEIRYSFIKFPLLYLAILSQIYIVNYFDYYNFTDLCGYKPKPISNYVLTHYPSWYNPDPAIFINRYAPGMEYSIAESPAVIRKNDSVITKLLVHKKYVKNLERYGVTQKQIDSLTPLLKFEFDWAYIDVNENFKLSYALKLSKRQKIEEKIKLQIMLMKSSKEWYDLIKQKAAAQSITEDEMLRTDAIFMLKIEPELTKDFTKQERIDYTISKMKANMEWKNKLIDKAKQLNQPIEQVMYEDAKFIVEKDLK